jgi:putative GTP pyrophosphokinase
MSAPYEELAAIVAVVKAGRGFSKETVNRAAATLLDPSSQPSEQVEAARTIHNWRAAHQYPVTLFERFLSAGAQSKGQHSIVASRLKRVPTMLAKLARMNAKPRSRPFTLWEMQDVGGLRAIVETPPLARELADELVNVTKFQLVGRRNDYIAEPKESGYRSIHHVYRYLADPDEEPALNGMKFEVQFRSRLQHAWATANEVVGTFRGEELKSGLGNPEWLQFFSLSGAIIAQEEGTPIGLHVPQDPAVLRADFRSLRDRLNVFDRIGAYNVTPDLTQQVKTNPDARYFVLTFNLFDRTLKWLDFSPSEFADAASFYREREASHINDPNYDTVLVAVDSLAELRSAYPNYFADTATFLDTIYTAEELAKILADGDSGRCGQVRRGQKQRWPSTRLGHHMGRCPSGAHRVDARNLGSYSVTRKTFCVCMRREALASIALGLTLGTLYGMVGPLWTAYVVAVTLILAACWRQAGELTAAQHRLQAYRERAKYRP